MYNECGIDRLIFFAAKSKLCELPPSPGRCGAQHRRWYYNRHSSSCAWFYYSGCRGNANNFRTKAQCEQKCVSRSYSQLVEVEPFVVKVPTEIVSPQGKFSFTATRVSQTDKTRVRRRKTKKNRSERRRLRQEKRRLRKKLQRRNKSRSNHRKLPIEDNLTVAGSINDQAIHVYPKSGHTKRIKLFSILDKYPRSSHS